MNKILNDIGKIGMPYRENGKYLDDLIGETTEKAIAQYATARRHWHTRLKAAAAAAVVLLAVGLGIILFNVKDNQQVTMSGQGPLDEFLCTLSDDEAAQLTFYEIEEIPEY